MSKTVAEVHVFAGRWLHTLTGTYNLASHSDTDVVIARADKIVRGSGTFHVDEPVVYTVSSPGRGHKRPRTAVIMAVAPKKQQEKEEEEEDEEFRAMFNQLDPAAQHVHKAVMRRNKELTAEVKSLTTRLESVEQERDMYRHAKPEVDQLRKAIEEQLLNLAVEIYHYTTLCTRQQGQPGIRSIHISHKLMQWARLYPSATGGPEKIEDNLRALLSNRNSIVHTSSKAELLNDVQEFLSFGIMVANVGQGQRLAYRMLTDAEMLLSEQR